VTRARALAGFYFVTDAGLSRAGNASDVAAAIAGGACAVQYRAKDASARAMYAEAQALRALCGAVPFIVNDRVDVALAAGADGVHVGQDDLPVAAVRRVVGDELLVGLSTHSPEQIAAADGVDYIGVGPVFATPTKAGRAAVGLELVREAARAAAVPWFAIGGIDETNVADVVAAGATRIAVVRAIRDAADPRAAAVRLRSALPG
jgi:thiamine-phosphate pyrophosphorylase